MIFDVKSINTDSSLKAGNIMITPDEIKEIIYEQRLSQEEFALKINVTPEYLSRVLNGKNPVSHKFEAKLKELGLLEEPAPPQPEWQKELNLTDSECEKLFKTVKENKYKLFLAVDALNGEEESKKTLFKLLDSD